MSKFQWLQLLKYDHFLVFIDFYDIKLNLLGFWTVGWTFESVTLGFIN